MNNVSFRPQDIRRELTAHNAELSEHLNSLTSTIASINEYCSDGELLGLAFQAHKNLFMEGHIPFLNANCNAIREHQRANTMHISKLNILTHDFYDRRQLMDEIQHLNSSISSLQSQINSVQDQTPPGNAGSLMNLRNSRIDRRNVCQEMLNQLAAYESQTQGLYNGVEMQTKTANLLLQRIEGQRVNPQTGDMELPSLNEMELLELYAEAEALFRLLYPEGGYPNRDLIEEFLSSPTSLAEWLALAKLFEVLDASAHIEPNDLTQFLLSFTVPIGNVEIGWLERIAAIPFGIRFVHSQYTTWEFDTEKLGNLQQAVAMLKTIRGNELSEMERGMSRQNYINAYLSLSQRYSLLTMLPTLAAENRGYITPGGSIRTFEGPLTGVWGATGPSINIFAGDNGELHINYARLRNSTSTNLGGTRIDALHTSTLTLEGTAFGFGAFNAIRDEFSRAYEVYFSYCGVMSNIIKLAGKLDKTGLIGAMDMYMTENPQNAAQAAATRLNLFDLANFAGALGLTGTPVRDAHGNITHIITQPSFATEPQLQLLNEMAQNPDTPNRQLFQDTLNSLNADEFTIEHVENNITELIPLLNSLDQTQRMDLEVG